MSRDRTSDAARLAAICTGLLVLASVPVALAAAAAGPQAQTQVLQASNGSLKAREDAATLELYALESQLGQARSELAGIASRRATVERRRDATRRGLAIATEALHVSEARLGAIVRTLYEQSGRTDPLAVILGAASLEEALTGLDSLNRAAGENDRIVAQTRSARIRLRALGARLEARTADLARLAEAASARADELEAATAQRRLFVADLQRRQGLNAARIAALQGSARAARTRTVELTATAAPALRTSPTTEAREPAATLHTDGTLTVLATGYSIHGRTSTGIPTSHGVIAVDPAVIPLGTRLSIPGYGEGVAADTGGAVRGNVIDLWFPTRQQALAWGTRTVTVTVG